MDGVGVQPGARREQADMGSITRPCPTCGGFDEPGPHRIQFDVATQRQKIGVPIDEDRLESPLEHMANDPVAPIERLRVHRIDVAHEPREIRLTGMQHEMVVIPHQAVRHDDR